MQIPSAGTKEHTGITGRIRPALFRLVDIDDILVLCLSGFAIFTTQTAKDVPRLVDPPFFHKPAGRFGKGPYEREQKEEKDDLEADGETPTQGGPAAVDETQTVFQPVCLFVSGCGRDSSGESRSMD